MNRIVTIISLIASLITIGDMIYKIAFRDTYDYSTSISLILVIVVLQLSFYYLLDIKITKNESYISLAYFILIPLIISVSGWGFYKNANLDIQSSKDIVDVFIESFKAGLLIVITVGLFLFWSRATRSNVYKSNSYLSFAFGIPSVVIFLLASYRYTFSNHKLDVHFFGFIILLIITVALATIVKSTYSNKIIDATQKKTEEEGKNLSTTKTILVSIAITAITYAGITEHWFIAAIVAIVTVIVSQPDTVEKIVDKF